MIKTLKTKGVKKIIVKKSRLHEFRESLKFSFLLIKLEI